MIPVLSIIIVSRPRFWNLNFSFRRILREKEHWFQTFYMYSTVTDWYQENTYLWNVLRLKLGSLGSSFTSFNNLSIVGTSFLLKNLCTFNWMAVWSKLSSIPNCVLLHTHFLFGDFTKPIAKYLLMILQIFSTPISNSLCILMPNSVLLGGFHPDLLLTMSSIDLLSSFTGVELTRI